MIVDAKEHTTLKGFRKCLTFKAFLNKGLNDSLKTLLPNNFIPYPRPIVTLPTTINPDWLSGFTAGDGSFMIIISKNRTCLTGYQISAKFNIGQDSRDIE